MSDNEESGVERITVLAEEFTPAAMEYHRRQMGAQGYSLTGPIVPQRFFLTDGIGEPKPLFEGEVRFAATFVRQVKS